MNVAEEKMKTVEDIPDAALEKLLTWTGDGHYVDRDKNV